MFCRRFDYEIGSRIRLLRSNRRIFGVTPSRNILFLILGPGYCRLLNLVGLIIVIICDLIFRHGICNVLLSLIFQLQSIVWRTALQTSHAPPSCVPSKRRQSRGGAALSLYSPSIGGRAEPRMDQWSKCNVRCCNLYVSS